MYSLSLFVLSVLVKYSNASYEGHYECGAHGRFEYCIDGIPGCVVGCHCYPGYYFDSDSKICEPNTKLAHDFRRQYLEPTRVSSVSTSPTPTTINPIDKKVDSITQDADDLGDWLYNQFFKTIENQVINKTDGEPLTRRSGDQVAQPVPKRRYRKKLKKRSRNKRVGKKYKKRGLRRKLLRISEDDSLFDSDSESEDTDDSGSETDSDSDSSDSSRHHKHGRKILMINKKATTPLPSFIFLPNIETPYYPPIGLPPPPIMPMYPMVPVPPVGAWATKCDDATTSPPATTTQSTSATSTPTTTAATTAPSQEQNNQSEHLRKNGEHNKVMHLRNKMKKRKKIPTEHFMDQFQEQYQDPETSFFNYPDKPSLPMQLRSQPEVYDNMPPMEDVDFKYLSQLIHKLDSNKTTPNIPFNPNPDLPNFDPSMISRRKYDEMPKSLPPENYHSAPKLARPASKADEVKDSFYTNLGKQIATLIRKIDTNGQHDINIEINKENIKSPIDTIFNENRYAPRSYWERFVRSPLKSTFGEIRHSSDKLFTLEDQVNRAAAIERTLSLNELENIANIMKRTLLKPVGIKKIKITPQLPAGINTGLDFNLWPSSRRQNGQRSKVKTNNDNYVTEKNNLQRNTAVSNIPKSHRKEINTKTNFINQTKNNHSAVNSIRREDLLKKLFESPRITPLHHQVTRIVHHNETIPNTMASQQVIKYQLNPLKYQLNYKSINYVSNGKNRNQYHQQHTLLPIPGFSQHTFKSTNTKPSYFHHEFHHFDYFD